MPEIIATVERIREICLEKIERGEPVTINAIVREIGGSKKTVSRNYAIVMRELGLAGGRAVEPEVAHLQGIAEPFLKELWLVAKGQAHHEHRRHVKTLMDVQDSLIAQLEEFQSAVEEMTERAESAERRLDAQLAGESRLGSLIEMVEQLKADAVPRIEGRVGTGASKAVHDVLAILGVAEGPVGRVEVDRAMVIRSFTEAASQRARYHAMEAGYVGLVLTEKGQARLRELDISAMSERPKRA